MSMPTPDDLAFAPAWDNYLVAQTVHASLGLIPSNALCIGVAVSKAGVEIVFQMLDLTVQDQADIDEIVENLGSLIAFVVPVTSSTRVVKDREITPSGQPIRWLFLKRS